MLLVGTAQAGAQTDRNLIRQGNRAFKSQKWAVAETQYRKAISKNQKNPQAIYNLGCALMAQQKDSMAIQQFTNAAQLETNRLRRAASYHNMGVIMQSAKQPDKALEFYKQSLRNNPHSEQTRYNYALCLHQLKKGGQDNQDQQQDENGQDEKKKQEQQQQKDKQDKKNDKNKNKDGQNKNDQNKDKQNKNQDKNNSDKNKQNQEKMSRDNAEQLLNAAIQQEKATKRKMQKAMSQPRRKVYDKNW